MDYQAIIDRLTEEHVKQILTQLDIPFDDKGTYLLMPTYCHNHKSDEASRKLYYYKDNKIFMCYTECGSMSIFKFLKNYYEAQGIEYDWYSDVYRVIVGDETAREGVSAPKYESLKVKYSPKTKMYELPVYDEGVLDCFVKTYPPEWLNDGISKETMDKFEIAYSISQNKIIIPHRDIKGRLVGIRGRALNPWEVENVGKYMPVQIEGTWYKHPLSMNLYGLNYNFENIKKYGICYLFESEKSVMQFESFGLPNCGVAVCGSNFNKFQLKLLLTYCPPKEIVICFDNEELPGENKYFDKLWAIGEKYKNYCNFSFIYDRKGLTNLKDSPTDRGKEIFKELLSKRVNIR